MIIDHYILIHGIRKKISSPVHMKSLKEMLLSKDIRATTVNYGYILIPITNQKAISATVEAIEPYMNGDYRISLIGYSNGAWTALQVAEMGYPIDRLILISPALHSAHAFPEHVRKIDVFYCEDDIVGHVAKGWRCVTRLLPWRWKTPHAYGRMMQTGYIGKDIRVKNHKMPDRTGHTFYEHEHVVEMIVNVIAKG